MLPEQYLNTAITIFASILFLPLSIISLLINLLYACVLIHGHRYFCTKFVYICSRHLLVADLISSMTQIFVIVPTVILPYEIGREFLLSQFVETVLTCETLAHMATFHFMFLQSLGHVHNQFLFSQNEIALHTLNNWGSIICTSFWLWLAFLLLIFGAIFRCVLRFNIVNYSFYYVCYDDDNNGFGLGGAYLMKIFLGFLMLMCIGINLVGAVYFERKIQKLFPGNSRSNAISTTASNIRRTSISVSVIQRVHLQQQSIQSNQRKILYEMLRSKAFFVQGFYMSLSLLARYSGFHLIPLFCLFLYGNGIQTINERATINVIGNVLILVSLNRVKEDYTYTNSLYNEPEWSEDKFR
uniref:G_PROTEIN_RECEP_F1_2 domain-containing protein n=1 Tax=Meloidogyne hapla TaxID=6305 RepID=A0A1I8B5M4_MELHA